MYIIVRGMLNLLQMNKQQSDHQNHNLIQGLNKQLQLSKVLQPNTFTPSVGARTRYGVMSNPWDARNYYHFMKVTTYSADGYTWDSGRHFITKPSDVVPAFAGAQGGPVVNPKA